MRVEVKCPRVIEMKSMRVIAVFFPRCFRFEGREADLHSAYISLVVPAFGWQRVSRGSTG